MAQTPATVQITALCGSSRFSQQIGQTVLLAGVQYPSPLQNFSAIYRKTAAKTKITLHEPDLVTDLV